jgi:hypothetical protein
MAKINKNDPAFANPGNVFGKDDIQSPSTGMTIRQYFAARAMHALISAPRAINGARDVSPKEVVMVAVEIADALIDECNKDES